MLLGDPSGSKGLCSGGTDYVLAGQCQHSKGKFPEFSYLGYAKHLVTCAAHASWKLSDVLLMSVSTTEEGGTLIIPTLGRRG